MAEEMRTSCGTSGLYDLGKYRVCSSVANSRNIRDTPKNAQQSEHQQITTFSRSVLRSILGSPPPTGASPSTAPLAVGARRVT